MEIRRKRSRAGRMNGWTLVEFILVLATVALCLQLLLPALGAAREAARRIHCGRHLQQLGLAANMHHDLLNAYPSGGWHFDWIGEPERGTGPDQPGAWPYNLLNYLEATAMRDLGRNETGLHRARLLQQRTQTPIDIFHCPTRREAKAYPYGWNRRPRSQDGSIPFDLTLAAKTDYAANAGDQPETEHPWNWTGPQSLADGDRADFSWPERKRYTGVIFGRSRVRQTQIKDGLNQTYLFAEKYLDASQYRSGKDWGDNESLYSGFNNDNCRSASTPPHRDTPELDLRNSFGSAHATVWQAVMVDGSLRVLQFDIDPTIHRQMGSRAESYAIQDP